MKSLDFIYFIQGFFEISEAGKLNATLTMHQVELLKEQIDKLEKSELHSDTEQQCLRTISFINGVFASLYSKEVQTPEALESVSSIIQKKLEDTFIHSVDTSYEGDQKEFQDIHDGKSK